MGSVKIKFEGIMGGIFTGVLQDQIHPWSNTYDFSRIALRINLSHPLSNMTQKVWLGRSQRALTKERHNEFMER